MFPAPGVTHVLHGMALRLRTWVRILLGAAAAVALLGAAPGRPTLPRRRRDTTAPLPSPAGVPSWPRRTRSATPSSWPHCGSLVVRGWASRPPAGWRSWAAGSSASTPSWCCSAHPYQLHSKVARHAGHELIRVGYFRPHWQEPPGRSDPAAGGGFHLPPPALARGCPRPCRGASSIFRAVTGARRQPLPSWSESPSRRIAPHRLTNCTRK